MKSHQKIENSTWRPETTINCRRRCALPALTLPLSASVAPPTARWSSGYTGHRGGREEKQRLARKGSRVCVSTMKLGRGCQGQEGQRDDLPEDTHSHQSTHPRPHIEERSGRRTRRATSRIYGSLRGKAGRASEKRRGLSTLSSHCEAPHMGLAAADTKGQSSRRGRVGEDECEREEHWSSGCMGLEAAGEEREKETRPCSRFPIWGSLCQKGGQQRKRAGLRFPIFPIWGSNP